jgi:hypothetical protein
MLPMVTAIEAMKIAITLRPPGARRSTLANRTKSQAVGAAEIGTDGRAQNSSSKAKMRREPDRPRADDAHVG